MAAAALTRDKGKHTHTHTHTGNLEISMCHSKHTPPSAHSESCVIISEPDHWLTSPDADRLLLLRSVPPDLQWSRCTPPAAYTRKPTWIWFVFGLIIVLIGYLEYQINSCYFPHVFQYVIIVQLQANSLTLPKQNCCIFKKIYIYD